MNQSNESCKHILALGGIDHTYRHIEALGHSFSLIQNKSLVTSYQIEHASELILSDYQDVEAMLKYAAAIHQRKPVDYVLCMSEYPQLAAAAITDALNVQGNCRTSAVKNTRNKYFFRELLDRHGIPNIEYRIVDSPNSLKEFLSEVDGRAVIKPVYGAGSTGVQYVDSSSDITAAYEFTAGSGQGEVLAEEFVEGVEYSVESMSINGKHEVVAITQKRVSNDSHLIEMGHFQPADLGPLKGQIDELIKKMLDALEHSIGPAHTEIKVNGCQIRLIESQVRLGGDQIWEMTMWTSGVDVTKETILCLLNEPLPNRAALYPCVAIEYFNLPPCRLSKDELYRKYEADRTLMTEGSGIIRMMIDRLSTQPQKVTHSGDRSGYVLAYGSTVKAAQALASQECAKVITLANEQGEL